MRVLMTDQFCERAKATSVQTDFFDTKVPGLALRAGIRKRTWCLFHNRRRLTLGAYPAMSLAAARAAALAMKGGGQPEATLATVFEEYMAREGAALRSANRRRADFNRLVLPTLGQRPIGDIRRSEITALLDRIGDTAGPSVAHIVLTQLSKLFNWYASRADDFRSPVVRGMGRYDGKARERVLSDEELRALWSATDGEAPFARFIRFLLLTATRRNEAAFATWAEFDGDVWTIPPERYKTGVEHVIPLSPLAQGSVVGSPQGRLFEFGSPARRKAELDAASGVRDWRLHDLRRTARSLMSRAGVAPDVAERCLGHVIPGVRGVYDRHEYLEEKRQAFEALAALVEGIVR
jgi:integrase